MVNVVTLSRIFTYGVKLAAETTPGAAPVGAAPAQQPQPAAPTAPAAPKPTNLQQPPPAPAAKALGDVPNFFNSGATPTLMNYHKWLKDTHGVDVTSQDLPPEESAKLQQQFDDYYVGGFSKADPASKTPDPRAFAQSQARLMNLMRHYQVNPPSTPEEAAELDWAKRMYTGSADRVGAIREGYKQEVANPADPKAAPTVVEQAPVKDFHQQVSQHLSREFLLNADASNLDEQYQKYQAGVEQYIAEVTKSPEAIDKFLAEQNVGFKDRFRLGAASLFGADKAAIVAGKIREQATGGMQKALNDAGVKSPAELAGNPEAFAKFKTAFAAATENPKVAGEVKAAFDSIATAATTDAAAGAVEAINKALDMPESNYGDYMLGALKDNWGAALGVVGLALMMFGGDTGKMLGLLAIGVGGYQVYNKYQEAQDPAAQKLFAEFLEARGTTGRPITVEEFKQMKAQTPSYSIDPTTGQQVLIDHTDNHWSAVSTLLTLTKLGFANKVSEMTQQTASKTVENLGFDTAGINSRMQQMAANAAQQAAPQPQVG